MGEDSANKGDITNLLEETILSISKGPEESGKAEFQNFASLSLTGSNKKLENCVVVNYLVS